MPAAPVALISSDRRVRHGAARWAIPALVAIVTLAAFAPVVRNGFVQYDDDYNFLVNPAYRGLGLQQLKWMFTTFHMGHYIPLTWLTLGLDYAIWGLNPAGYHLTSLVLHLVVVLLFYFLAIRLLRLAVARGDPDEGLWLRLGAGLAALIFAVHPLRVESVAWATERRDVLVGVFFLGAVLAYLRAHADPRPASAWLWTSVALAGCALLSKSIAVSLPIVLLATDVYPLRRLPASTGWLGPEARRIYLEKVPYVVLSSIAGVLAFLALFTLNNMATLQRLSLSGRLAVSSYAVVFYLWKTVVPVGLSPLFELKRVWPLEWPFVVSGAVVLAVSGLAVHFRRRWPALGVVWVAYLAMLLPVLGFFQNGPQIAADRYTYLACLGWALLLGAGLVRYLQSAVAHPRPGVIIALSAAAVIALSGLTWRQVGVWRDTRTLWEHALAVDPRNSTAANNVAVAMLEASHVAWAEGQLEKTIREVKGGRDDMASRFFLLGWTLQKAGDLDGSVRYYREALAADPRYAEAWNNLGVVYATRAQFTEALDMFVHALAVKPHYASACSNARSAARIAGASPPIVAACRGSD